MKKKISFFSPLINLCASLPLDQVPDYFPFCLGSLHPSCPKHSSWGFHCFLISFLKQDFINHGGSSLLL